MWRRNIKASDEADKWWQLSGKVTAPAILRSCSGGISVHQETNIQRDCGDWQDSVMIALSLLVVECIELLCRLDESLFKLNLRK